MTYYKALHSPGTLRGVLKRAQNHKNFVNKKRTQNPYEARKTVFFICSTSEGAVHE